MSVNHFGPFTIDEELAQRVSTIGGEILRAYESCEEARRKLNASAEEARRLKALRNDYISVLVERSKSPTKEHATWAENTKMLNERIEETMVDN